MFAEPDRFDIARPADNTHLMFCHGSRYCFGATPARVVLTSAVERLFRKFPALELVVSIEELSWPRHRPTGGLAELPVRRSRPRWRAMTVHALDWTYEWHNVEVGALDRWSDAPDRARPTEAADSDAVRAEIDGIDATAETRSRAEVYADTRQSVESGWERHRPFDPPRAELARFKPEQAGLPETSLDEGARYVEQHRTSRPWLDMAERATPESRRIIAAVDQGAGHGHIRHEGWVTEEANMRRAAYLEDPAQLDATKQHRGIDGLKPNDKRHICADLATRIADPDAFATAFSRGAEHADVRAALSSSYDQGKRPDPVRVPIADLLGKDGHTHCTGWQLEPVGGSMDTAIKDRHAWRAAVAEGRQPDVPEPTARPVPTFEGGDIIFLVGHNKARDGYEIVTLYPQPGDDEFPASSATAD